MLEQITNFVAGAEWVWIIVIVGVLILIFAYKDLQRLLRELLDSFSKKKRNLARILLSAGILGTIFVNGFLYIPNIVEFRDFTPNCTDYYSYDECYTGNALFRRNKDA